MTSILSAIAVLAHGLKRELWHLQPYVAGCLILLDGPATGPVPSSCLVQSPAVVIMAEEEDLSPNLLTGQPIHGNGDFVPPDGLCWVSVLSCLLLACSYVGSLYVWRSDLPRWAEDNTLYELSIIVLLFTGHSISLHSVLLDSITWPLDIKSLTLYLL